jgi:CheY-like chemotaxis protein
MTNNKESKKILVIDDEKSFAEILCFALEKENFTVGCYTDPQLALKEILNFKDSNLILLDLSMPKIDGFELLTRIKNDLQNNIPIVIITNLRYTKDGREINEELIKTLGVKGLIKKTADLSEIVNQIKKFLNNGTDN